MRIPVSTLRLLSAAALMMAATAHSADGPPRPSPVISHAELQEALKDPKVRLLDARPKADYDKGHVPGAVWVDTKAVQALTKAATVKDAAAWNTVFAPLGINSDIRAVYVYDNDRQHDAARIWWSLNYIGVAPAGLVDGGFDLWQRDKRPVTTEPTAVAPADIKPAFHDEHLTPRDTVAKGDVQLLDGRSPEEYTGEKPARTPTSPVGHIPGAQNLNSYSLVDEDGRFLDRDAAALRDRFKQAGVATDKPVVAYSAGGNRSSILLFALNRAGIPSSHYIGGVGDWTREGKKELVKGKAPK